MASSGIASLGFLLLTGNSIVAICRSLGDTDAMIFVIASYGCLVLLFNCLRRVETAARGSIAQDRARFGVWLLTTLLTAMFWWRVAAIVPWALATGVWLIAASTVLLGFYCLFLLPRAGD